MTLEISAAPQERLLAWLTSDAVLEPDGAVMSWWNATHRGYPYPEIAGYMLSTLATEGDATRLQRNRIAARLLRDMRPDGSVGRGPTSYVFDSAMVLTGLLAHERAGGVIPDPTAVHRLFRYISLTLNERRATTGAPGGDPDHWSQSYGCHLLKVAISLAAYGAGEGEAAVRPLVRQLYNELSGLYDGGRFRVNSLSDLTYLHAHCYAVEGLLAMDARDAPGRGPLIEGAATWLARIQDESGGIRARHDGIEAQGPLRADATAQAVRIWSIVDREAYGPSIDRALAFLEELFTPDGGLRYEPGSDDVNTWVSMFALQAFRLAESEEMSQWIV